MSLQYDGYTSCPLITARGKCILAEFDFDGNPLETFPINQGVERRTMYHMKKDMMPQLYWHLMMKYVKLLDFFLAQRDSWVIVIILRPSSVVVCKLLHFNLPLNHWAMNVPLQSQHIFQMIIPSLTKETQRCQIGCVHVIDQGQIGVYPSKCLLTSLSQITVRFKGILKSASFPNSQIYGRFIA